ncbi:hypothetical protein GLOIN_2v1770792 [Rhizophagus irregularis DAOM 181602=DAOM 197198]|nr:hypothetical protein GLOIN_2v1770792 [Rhizophagus irregularis DAOM 181602=DAOM 197198]POG74952.1 hypothetical protein GLOIN_2v1770792 [Rhizophagus irregularis DAOM 181602=DAOM 197198]|eukprot:XP_025181818.1 hypothetical protein GLOIN_2v1770792 [Rhizophagus irregularis DAOM 181602=DAOM 197198]
MNIPVLVDYQWEKDKEKARDLFFYDVPRFWREEDMGSTTPQQDSKLGKNATNGSWLDLTDEEMKEAKDNEYDVFCRHECNENGGRGFIKKRTRRIRRYTEIKRRPGIEKKKICLLNHRFNYLTDERKTGEKRPKLESPGVTISKPKDTKKDQKKKKKKEQD